MESYIIGLGTIAVLIVISAVWHWRFGGARAGVIDNPKPSRSHRTGPRRRRCRGERMSSLPDVSERTITSDPVSSDAGLVREN